MNSIFKTLILLKELNEIENIYDKIVNNKIDKIETENLL